MLNSDNVFELNMKINNLKDMLLSDVDMPDDVAQFQMTRLRELEEERDRIKK